MNKINRNRARISGIIRVCADSLTIISGAGFNVDASIFRIMAGSLGILSSFLLALFGKTNKNYKYNIVEVTGYIAMCAGSCLFISGIVTKRPFESIAGFNIALGFGIQAFIKETTKQNESKSLFQTLKYKVCSAPVKLGSDILQINVILILIDAIPNGDWARTLVGILFAISSINMRFVKKNQYQ